MITEQDFKDFHWDCDICPLYSCHRNKISCFNKVIEFWKMLEIVPQYGFTQAILSREERK